eukprot:12241825-Alexandrium_andersonii.AAC.1
MGECNAQSASIVLSSEADCPVVDEYDVGQGSRSKESCSKGEAPEAACGLRDFNNAGKYAGIKSYEVDEGISEA